MNGLKWKRRLGGPWGVFQPARPRRLILLYHAIGKASPAVAAEKFREQLDWLSRHARIISLDGLLASHDDHGLEVAITFDDGYASLYESAAPILAEYGASATVFLNTGWIGETARRHSDANHGHYPNESFLTWAEVEALAGAGWSIGSHGVEHFDLTRQEAAVVTRELAESKREIETRLGRPCRHFAYTWGRFTPSLQGMVRAAGYESAVSGLHGPVSSNSDIYALPRIDVRAEYELRDFIAAVSGRWDFLGLKQRLMRKSS